MVQVLRCRNKGIFTHFLLKLLAITLNEKQKYKLHLYKTEKKSNSHQTVFLPLTILFPNLGRVSPTFPDLSQTPSNLYFWKQLFSALQLNEIIWFHLSVLGLFSYVLQLHPLELSSRWIFTHYQWDVVQPWQKNYSRVPSKKLKIEPGMVAHTFKFSTLEAELA